MNSPAAELENVGLSDFLRVIFHSKTDDERVFANITDTRAPSDSDPRKFWSGRSESEVDRFGRFHGGNTYYCVASVLPDANGTARRAMSHFGGLYVLVLDDVRDLNPFMELDPTYVLETSPGNYQIGFKFTHPIGNLAVAKALTKSLADKGFAGNDPSGNNPVRWVRAPGGKNWKYKPAFTHRLIVWQPELMFDPENVAAFLNLSMDPIKDDPKPAAPPTSGSILEGNRNGALTSMAGAMRRKGMGEEAIYAALSVENEAQCIPPLPAAEVAAIARSVARYEPSEVYQVGVGAAVEASLEAAKPDFMQVIPVTVEEMENARITPRVIIKNFLYADVRVRYAAGGTGKTTVALYEAIISALGRRIWGYLPERPIKTLIVSREDSREILLARAWRICKHLNLSADEMRQVTENLSIIDAIGVNCRLSMVSNDVVVPNRDAIDRIIDNFGKWAPDWVIFDPLISFGVGESRVNDAEQGIIEAARIIRGALDCCTEAIHHVSKAASADGRDDQYIGRGGSALSDGSRMVATMRLISPEEFVKDTGIELAGRSGIKMSLPKLSYAAAQQPIYIARDGYGFDYTEPQSLSPEEQANSDALRLHAWLKDEESIGLFYSVENMEKRSKDIGMARNRIRTAFKVLSAKGGVKPPKKGPGNIIETADFNPVLPSDENF